VQSARVHLAIPKPTIFVREQQKPSASVLVNLYPGKLLDSAQVSAVVHLVANSVPELAPTSISVLDQNGNLLSQPTDGAGANRALEPGQLKYVRDMENSLADRVRAILTPIMGPNNVQAQVTADIDFSETETVAESYKPNQNQAEAAVRSQQSSESMNNNAANGGGGVPGALSNQPPGQASAPIAGQAQKSAAGAGQNATTNSRRDTTTNYEIDKTTKHTRDALGRLKRLSVAVVLNHRQVTDKQGKVSQKALPKTEIDQITDLVKDAIGFNKDRGDSVNVVNSSFATVPTAPIEVLPLWKQPESIAMAKDVGKHLLIAVVLLYLVLGVIRPLIRTLAAPAVAVAGPGGELALAERLEPTGDVASLPAPSAMQLDSQLQKTRELAKQDPQMVASVLKNWMGSNSE
jgi:flagellar M-ring protein FliF